MQNHFQFKGFFNIFNERKVKTWFFNFANDESMLLLLCSYFFFDSTWTWFNSVRCLDLYLLKSSLIIYSHRPMHFFINLASNLIPKGIHPMCIPLILTSNAKMPVSVILRFNVSLILRSSYINHHLHFSLIKWKLGSRKIKDLCLPLCCLYSSHCTIKSSKLNLS